QRQLLAQRRFGSLGECREIVGRERFEPQYLAARQQRGIELETWVLGRGPDQHHGAVFHDRQEPVLLGPVEAVDLIDEEQRAMPAEALEPRLLEDLLEVGNAGEDRRYLLEDVAGLVGEEACDGGLARARRPPQDQRPEPPRR